MNEKLELIAQLGDNPDTSQHANFGVTPEHWRDGAFLAPHCARFDSKGNLYVMDEPTTGLHPADIDRLLAIIDRLIDAGNTVIVIEHNLDVIAAVDWIIDVGPEGGRQGGHIVAEGTPETIAADPSKGHTGRYLHRWLTGQQSS